MVSENEIIEMINNKEYTYTFFKKLLNYDLFFPFSGDHFLYVLTDEEHKYIALFTNENKIKNMEYTRVDKVKLKTIIEDIYDKGGYYAISINPYTEDFIINKKIIELLKKIYM